MGKASEIWKEIKPKIGEMLLVVNNIETQAEKAQEEAYQKGVQDTKQHWVDAPRSCAYKLGYENGLNDAWETARKIAINEASGGLSLVELDKIFSCDDLAEVFGFTASEAIEKIRQYEQKQEEIKVGDEVEWMGDKYVVTYVRCEAKKADLISCKFGNACENVAFSALVKTGRTFPEIAVVLQKMKE